MNHQTSVRPTELRLHDAVWTCSVFVPPESEPLNAVRDEDTGVITVFWRVRNDLKVPDEPRAVVVVESFEPLPNDQPYGYLAVFYRKNQTALHVFTDLKHSRR